MPSTISNAINEIDNDLENMGYHLTNTSVKNENQLVSLGTSYSIYNGFGTALGNDIWQNIEYGYSDSLGNEVAYGFKYKTRDTRDDEVVITEIQLVGCKAKKDYESICGSRGVVRDNFSKAMDNKTEAEFFSKGKTLGLVLGLGGGVYVALLVFLMLL